MDKGLPVCATKSTLAQVIHNDPFEISKRKKPPFRAASSRAASSFWLSPFLRVVDRVFQVSGLFSEQLQAFNFFWLAWSILPPVDQQPQKPNQPGKNPDLRVFHALNLRAAASKLERNPSLCEVVSGPASAFPFSHPLAKKPHVADNATTCALRFKPENGNATIGF